MNKGDRRKESRSSLFQCTAANEARIVELAKLRKDREALDEKISAVHGNFIVNNGDAKAADVLQLMSEIELEVLRQTGIHLEREVRFLE